MFKKLLVSIFITALAWPLCAEDVDLRPEFGPMRDQRGLGFCYAYATADLLSYWLNNTMGFKNNPKKDTRKKDNMVSALAYALSFNRINMLEGKRNIKKYRKELKALASKLDEQQKNLDIAVDKILKSNYEALIINRKLLAMEDKDSETCGFTFSNECYFDQEQYDELVSKMMEILYGYPEYEKAANDYTRSELALVSLEKQERKEEEGGDLDPELDLKSVGICFEREVNSEGGQYSDPSWTYKEPLLYYPEDFLKESYGVYSTGSAPKNTNIIFPKVKDRIVKRAYSKYYKKKDDFDPIAKLLKKSCGSKRLLGKKAPVIKVSDDLSNIFDLIDKQLDKKNPVYMGYNALVFVSHPSLWGDSFWSHASVIVGRLSDSKDGSKEYIIRNSYGAKACETDHKNYFGLRQEDVEKEILAIFDNIEKKCPSNNERSFESCKSSIVSDSNIKEEKLEEEAPRPFRCDPQGYYIIKKETLAKAIIDIAWLENKNEKGLKK